MSAILSIISFALLLYIIAIVGVILGSWFPMEPDGPAARVFVTLRRITDPVLEPVRRIIPPIGGRIDVSPMLVVLVLSVIRGIIGS